LTTITSWLTANGQPDAGCPVTISQSMRQTAKAQLQLRARQATAHWLRPSAQTTTTTPAEQHTKQPYYVLMELLGHTGFWRPVSSSPKRCLLNTSKLPPKAVLLPNGVESFSHYRSFISQQAPHPPHLYHGGASVSSFTAILVAEIHKANF
jgi:hypothetical protein